MNTTVCFEPFIPAFLLTLAKTEFTRARVKHSWDRPVYGDDEYNKGFVLKGLEVKTHYATAA